LSEKAALDETGQGWDLLPRETRNPSLQRVVAHQSNEMILLGAERFCGRSPTVDLDLRIWTGFEAFKQDAVYLSKERKEGFWSYLFVDLAKEHELDRRKDRDGIGSGLAVPPGVFSCDIQVGLVIVMLEGADPVAQSLKLRDQSFNQKSFATVLAAYNANDGEHVSSLLSNKDSPSRRAEHGAGSSPLRGRSGGRRSAASTT
jgi:hypothetical protein